MKIVRTLSICILLFFSVGWMAALDPHTLISQYGHTAWRAQDGFINATDSITQTTDGYIWIAAAGSVFRFDGVTFRRWTPPNHQSLPSTYVQKVLGARDGSLWIGTTGGLAHWKDGRLTNYTTTPASPAIFSLLEDHGGRIWVTRYKVNDGMGSLCWAKESALECYGEKDGNPAKYAGRMIEDGTGDLWFTSVRLYRWHQGSATTYFNEQMNHPIGVGVHAVCAGGSGEIWASLDGLGPKAGVQRFSDGKWASYIVPGFDGRTVKAEDFFFDRNKTLWIGTFSNGLYHIHDGWADHYGFADGLSSDHVNGFFEDSEGNLWVGTTGGIDLFRDNAILNFSKTQGLAGTDAQAVLSANGDAVWVADEEGLAVIPAGTFMPVRSSKVPGHNVSSLFVDSKGQVWLGVDNKVFAYNNQQYIEVKKTDGSALGQIENTSAFAEDIEGNLWAIAYSNGGGSGYADLLLIRDQQVRADFRLEDSATDYLAADRRSGIWALSERGKLTHYIDGRAQESVQLGNASRAYSLDVDSHNSVWAATNKGLYRWNDGQLTLMDEKNGLPCPTVYSLIQDDQGSYWLRTDCGILRFTANEWERWQKFPESKLSFVIFDALDGARPDISLGTQPSVTKSRDGRLWFAAYNTVQMIDPNRPTNSLPPPVHIEGVIADHKTYESLDKVAVPHLRGELEIDYTALSFKIPQRVLFRYKLEGHDTEWNEVGTRRQAFYTDLPPKKYRFRVIACNNDGVWNETGAFLDFAVLPAYYQTVWFRALCEASFLLLLWFIYQIRLRQIRHQFNIGLEAQLNERMRIARDFHDTYLQTIQGSKLVADSALKQSPDPTPMRGAMQQLSVWLGRATEEGRATLNSLRTSATEQNDLAAAFRRAMEECRISSSMDTPFSVVGEVSEMHPIIRDEIYRIGYEAIRNACVHSQANRLQVELTYADDLTLRVRDNGVGIDPSIVDQGKQEHFGLQGMRERAHRIMAKFTINTSPGAGTEITLVVPGSIIYRTTDSRGRKWPAIESLLRRMGLGSNSADS